MHFIMTHRLPDVAMNVLASIADKLVQLVKDVCA
jgi:hypothetical protein